MIQLYPTTSSTSVPAGSVLVWQGDWSNTENYVVNDVVLFNGLAYVCVNPTTGTAPDASQDFVPLAPSQLDASQIVYEDPQYPTVSDALSAVLYKAPQIVVFSNNVGIVEVGQTVDSVTLEWLFNKEMTSISLSGVGPIIDLNSSSYTINGPFTYNRSWTLTASDGQNTVSATTSVLFELKRYWGVSPNDTLTNDEILSFNNEFATDEDTVITYDCTGGAYPYYCYPVSWGQLDKVTINGFGFSAYTVTSQSVVNVHGHQDTYYVVRFNYLQNSDNLKISWQ